MPGQRLNYLERLAVVEQVHDVRVPECVRGHRHREMHAVVRRAPPGLFACHPHLNLAHIDRIGERHQAHRVLEGPPAPAPHLFREDAHKRAWTVDDERLGDERAALADARAGVPQRVKEKVVAPIGHIMKKRGDLGG